MGLRCIPTQIMGKSSVIIYISSFTCTVPLNRWLYWTDNQAGMIERVAVTGERRQLIQGGIRSCIWPVEIDYSEQNVYWANTCQNSLKSLNIGDSDQPVNRVQINSAFRDTYSMTIFEDTLYWNEGRMVKATNKSLDLGEVVTIFEPDETSLVFSIAVEVVHAKKQPEGNYSSTVLRK